MPIKGYRQTPQHRKHISRALKGKNRGTTRRPQTRAAIAASHLATKGTKKWAVVYGTQLRDIRTRELLIALLG